MDTSARVCVGIALHAEPDRLAATLAAVRGQTSRDVDIVLLPDGPDDATRRALTALHDVPQLSTLQPRGGAACFNRLAAHSDADIVILLESGAIVGPHWLDRLLHALAADPCHGLAGPSTNRSWNEQGGFATAQHAEHQAERTQWQTLEPLHSLADFCYVVKREVIQTIGAADEAYGLGPCWEMDYNIRAARAGFKGVWACGAYVHRAPFTRRRAHMESVRFEASRRLYQDRFCALRLRASSTGYESHCRGEACEHFAPPDLIRVHVPFAPQAAQPEPVVEVKGSSAPLVTCIMPTSGRRDFVRQSIGYFLRQDYPNRELIIVHDDDRTSVSDDPRVQTVHMPHGSSIGAKRNHACELARGSIIAHWDDDDWYAPGRLSSQIAPLLDGHADIIGLEAGTFFDLENWRFWLCTPELHQRLFVGDVHGGTLMYRRSVWLDGGRYPDRSLAEDAIFLRRAIQRGARLHKLANDGLFVYVRHGANAWAFRTGEYLDPRGWVPAPEPALPAADRAFYVSQQQHTHAHDGNPFVTCIMPTFNRRRFAAQAIRYFLRQDYRPRELLVLDDGDDRIADLMPNDASIRYVPLGERMVVGAKRNLACDLARGQLIAHWDDDDWIAPQRLRHQVEILQRTGADLCGSARQLYYEPAKDRAWLYEFPLVNRRWIAGNTLCYRKSFWERNRFANIQVGEDTRFVWSPEARNAALTTDDQFYVGMVHESNTSPKQLSGPYFHEHPVADVHRLLGEDLAFYGA